MTLAERVRQRLKEEKDARHLSQRDVAGLLDWPQSRVAQKLSGHTPITLDELEALCFGVSLSPTECVRDRGYEFCAELTPSELRLLERWRKLRPDQQQAIATILGFVIQTPGTATTPRRKKAM